MHTVCGQSRMLNYFGKGYLLLIFGTPTCSSSCRTLQIAGGARGGCAVGGEQPRGQVGDPGEGDAATEETQGHLRGAGAQVG